MGGWSKAERSGSVGACGVGPSVAAEPSIGGLPCWGKREEQGAVREARALPRGEAVDGLRLGTPECKEAWLCMSEGMIWNESRVREIRTISSASGERKRNRGGD